MNPVPILIVEDEGIVATDIEWQLQNLGYKPVGTAVTGEEAIALAERLKPALVLMDIRLAGSMDGIEAATIIRRRFDIPSVFLTAYATDDIVERAKGAAPLGYLIKPFEERSLRTTIEIALHKRELDGQLQASEARYRAVVQSAHDAIVVGDEAGRIVSWNPKATEMFGYTEAEVVGQPLILLVPPRAHAEHLAGMKRAFAGEPVWIVGRAVEVPAARKDGSEFPVEISLSVWESLEGKFATAIVRDISERKRTEGLVRLQSAALEAAANGIVLTDADGTIVWVNAAFSALTGYSRDEAVGHNPRDLVKSGVHDQAFYQQLWGTITAGRVWAGEMTNRKKDGSHYHESQTITPVRDSDGHITHFVAIKNDLTEEKRRNAAFLQAQKMEVVGRLVGGVAHDFSNMLTVINGTSGLLLDELGADDPLRSDLQQIRDAGDRAAAMSRQLLGFSRKQVAVPEVLSVGAQVQASARMLHRLIGEDINLVINAGDRPDHVRIDPGQFEQVLMNLVVNARDAMPGGGVLTIATQEVTLGAADVPAGSAAGPYVRLSVTDTGVGMPPEVLARLFEPFFTTKEEGKGTGLGLATVSDIVRKGGGRIAVTSAVGSGSTFHVDLPRTAAEPAGGSAAAGRIHRGSETILIVEDDDALRMLTERLLRKAGYRVLGARSGEHAHQLLDQNPAVDLMLVDVVMPGMSGVTLAARVAATRPGLKVLFMSGYTGDRLPAEVLQEGVPFIPKPFTSEALTARVRQVLDTPAPGAAPS